MEVLGGVASVITVVTLALQSTKVIYEAASSMTHGSDGINGLARATRNLENFLEIIKRVAEHAERTNSAAEGKIFEEIKPLLDQCADALREIAPKIVKFQKDSNDRRWKKAKKYAKVYLDTRGVTEIWNTVNHHVELLGSCLSNASVDVGLHNAQNLRLFRDEFSVASRDNRSCVEEVLQKQRALAQTSLDAFQAGLHQSRVTADTQTQGIAELRAVQQQFGEAAAVEHQNVVEIRGNIQNVRAFMDDKSREATIRSEALLIEVREGFSETLGALFAQTEEIRRMKAEITPKLQSIPDRLEAVPGIAGEQLAALQSHAEMFNKLMFNKLQVGVPTRRQSSPTSTPCQEPYVENNQLNNSEMSQDLEFKGVMARICHFAHTTKTSRYSIEAQSVIEDIGRLLGLVMQHFGATSLHRDDLPKIRKTLCEYHYSEVETAFQSMESLRNAKRILTASQWVRISNQGRLSHQPICSNANCYRETHQMDEEVNNSERPLPKYPQNSLAKKLRRRRISSISLQSIVRSWEMQYGRVDAIFRTNLLSDAEDQDPDEEFASKLLVTPKSTSISNFRIIIDLASRIDRNRTICFTPTLTFRAIIPDDSEVFGVVERGSVKKLMRLLNSGAASLGDCDSMGRSLLNFALYKSRRKMTKFLIQSGADVDTLEPRHPEGIQPHDLIKPLEMSSRGNDSEHADEDLVRTEGCYKLLLDAGSDPTSIGPWGVTDTEIIDMSAFGNEVRSGTLSKMKALLDLGEPFVNLESTGDDHPVETIPLLDIAWSHSECFASSNQVVEKFALLLSRGANVKAMNARGETCLHLVLGRHSHYEDCCWCEDGAKVSHHLCETKELAILGISAGADVCAVDEEGRSVSDVAYNSGLQGIWTEALKYCRIDIKDVLARPTINPAHSTALNPEYSQPSRAVTSRVSLAEYLEYFKRRKPMPPMYEKLEPEISSSEEDESSSSGEDETEEGESEENESAEWSSDEEATVSKKEPHVRYTRGISTAKAKLE